jgi:hypothetical protein
MSTTRLLLLTITATLLVETQCQSSWVRWLDKQYEVVRRGLTWGLQQTGSASKRGIVTTRPAAAGSSIFLDTAPQDGSLRPTSQYFNVSRILWFAVFWVVTSCGLEGGYQRFGVIYCLHLQGRRPWRLRHPTPPKHWYPLRRIHDVTTQKTAIYISANVRFSNNTKFVTRLPLYHFTTCSSLAIPSVCVCSALNYGGSWYTVFK